MKEYMTRRVPVRSNTIVTFSTEPCAKHRSDSIWERCAGRITGQRGTHAYPNEKARGRLNRCGQRKTTAVVSSNSPETAQNPQALLHFARSTCASLHGRKRQACPACPSHGGTPFRLSSDAKSLHRAGGLPLPFRIYPPRQTLSAISCMLTKGSKGCTGQICRIKCSEAHVPANMAAPFFERG